MDENNFKRLSKIEEGRCDVPTKIEHNLQHSVNFFGLVGNLIEVFLPSVFDVFVAMNGGEKGSTENTKAGKYSPDRNSTPSQNRKTP